MRSLTDRQRQILRLVAAGYTAKEIGRMLHITSKTVEFHKGRTCGSCSFNPPSN